MGLCESISIIVKEIENQLIDITTAQLNMISVIKNAPYYLENNNLSQFDSDYRKAMNAKEENEYNFQIIELIYELPALNLYGVFQKKETEKLYKLIFTQLEEKQIIISKNLPMQDW